MDIRVTVRDRLPTVLSVCAHRFFFYAFTASDGSVGAIAGLLALLWCIMALEVRRQGVHEDKISFTPNNIALLTVGCPPR